MGRSKEVIPVLENLLKIDRFDVILPRNWPLLFDSGSGKGHSVYEACH
jgi:hypothetical protein